MVIKKADFLAIFLGAQSDLFRGRLIMVKGWYISPIQSLAAKRSQKTAKMCKNRGECKNGNEHGEGSEGFMAW